MDPTWTRNGPEMDRHGPKIDPRQTHNTHQHGSALTHAVARSPGQVSGDIPPEGLLKVSGRFRDAQLGGVGAGRKDRIVQTQRRRLWTQWQTKDGSGQHQLEKNSLDELRRQFTEPESALMLSQGGPMAAEPFSSSQRAGRHVSIPSFFACPSCAASIFPWF